MKWKANLMSPKDNNRENKGNSHTNETKRWMLCVKDVLVNWVDEQFSIEDQSAVLKKWKSYA